MRTGIDEPDAINARGLGRGIEDDRIVVGLADGEVGDGRVRAVGPDAVEHPVVVAVVHALPGEDDVCAPGRASNGDIVAPIDGENAGELVGAVGEQEGVAMAKIGHGSAELWFGGDVDDAGASERERRSIARSGGKS